MWTLMETTETMERYTYGQAMLDVWQDDDGYWWGNAYGYGTHGYWSQLWIGAKDEVLDELLNYAKLHEEVLPFPVRWWDDGRPVIEINNEFYRVTRHGDCYRFVCVPYGAVNGTVDRIENIPTAAARIRAALDC